MCAGRRRTTQARASSTAASATFTARSLVPTESTSTWFTSYRRPPRRTSFRQLRRRNAPRDNDKRKESDDHEQEAHHDDLDDGCARECGGGGDSRGGRGPRAAAAGGRLQHGVRAGISQPEFEWAGQHDGREWRERQRRRRRKHARHARPLLALPVHVLLRPVNRTARVEEGEARECGPFLPEGSIKGSVPGHALKLRASGTFAEPSSGLEPETPSLPWRQRISLVFAVSAFGRLLDR